MKKIVLLCISIFMMTACSTGNDVHKTIDDYPASYMLSKKVRIDYQPGLECSAFASSYLLRFDNEEAEGLKVFEDFPGKLAGGGVKPQGIVDFFNERGYQAEFKTDGNMNDLKYEISLGRPVIVFVHVEEPYTSVHYTHYVPIVGYDEKFVYFAESLEYLANAKGDKQQVFNRKTTIQKFEKLWADIDGYWDYPYFKIMKEF